MAMTQAQRRIIQSLIEVGSIAPDRVAAGLRVIGTSRRERVWVVHVTDGPSFVVKAASDADGRRRLTHEAAVHERLRRIEHFHEPFVPALRCYDGTRGLLVLDYVNGTSLAELATQRRDNDAPATELGKALERLHHAGIDPLDSGLFVSHPPWVVNIHHPDLGWYTRSSEASLRMRAIIQEHPALGAALDALRDDWTANAIIHADLKLEHVLISRVTGRRTQRISIIDWELAQLGDAAWDIGAIFAGYLLRWLRSIPLVSGVPPGELTHLATVPIQRVQAAMNAFWRGYLALAALDANAHRPLLLRATRSAAAVMIQREEEYLQSAASTSSRTRLILQVSNNILANPEGGVAVLLGIGAGNGDEQMISHRRQVEQVIRATTIRQPFSFTWFGQPSRLPPDTVRTLMSASAARQYLQATTGTRLYSDFYLPGNAMARRRERTTLPVPDTQTFIAGLEAANTGGGTWSSGWTELARTDSEVVLHNDQLDLALWLNENDIREARAHDVEVRLPAALPSWSPGFWLAIGDAPVSERTEQRVRFYWNLLPDGAALLVEHATRCLNDAAIPFQLKLVADPARYTRCDAGVLYLATSTIDRAWPMIQSIHDRIQPWLKPAIPALTTWLARGLAMADDPGNDESFGTRCCRLLANALIAADDAGITRVPARLDMVLDHLVAHGIAIDHPESAHHRIGRSIPCSPAQPDCDTTAEDRRRGHRSRDRHRDAHHQRCPLERLLVHLAWSDRGIRRRPAHLRNARSGPVRWLSRNRALSRRSLSDDGRCRLPEGCSCRNPARTGTRATRSTGSESRFV